MHHTLRPNRLLRILLIAMTIAGTAACGSKGATTSASPSLPTLSTSPSPAETPASTGTPAPSTAVAPSASQEPDNPTGTSSGDVPDNAVFLTYHDPKGGYSIQYVEGWQVSPVANGTTIRDKDSSETIEVANGPTDAALFLAGTDLPSLQAQQDFKLIKQDSVKVNGKPLLHLLYETLSPPDPVTGKQVAQAVDRYYVPGSKAIAVVTLATPKGVDNVDAFRQMIESFRWA